MDAAPKRQKPRHADRLSRAGILRRVPGTDLWDAGEVAGTQTTIYGVNPGFGQSRFLAGPGLHLRREKSEWSQTARFENGLLTPQEWTGPWIGMD